MNLVVLYGIGGLSDVGRHAIVEALKRRTIDKITVITEYPEMLDETNWECNCPGGHTNPFNDPDAASRLEMVKIDTWKNDQPGLAKHFEGAAVVSCLGHRQPGWKNHELVEKGIVARDGSRQVIAAMVEAKAERVVAISSISINGDKSWPHWANAFMKCLFCVTAGGRKSKKDLVAMEKAYAASSLDYLIVRTVGIGEDVVPKGRYYLQESGKKKVRDVFEDTTIEGVTVGGNMAKLDAARFMVDEAMNPTLHRTSQTIGAKPGTPMSG